MLAQLAKNPATGNTQITVDDADLELFRKALWDEMMFLAGTMRRYSDHRQRLWQEYEERWLPLAKAIGAYAPFAKYDEIVRRGIEV